MNASSSQSPAPRRLSPREIEQLQEVVIRAHYLALELRDLCAPSGAAPAEMSVTVSQMVKSWALAFGAALRRLEREAATPPT